MKHFFNIVNKYIDNIDLDSDVFSITRKEYFLNDKKTIDNKITYNNDDFSTNYVFRLEIGKVMKYVTFKDGKQLSESKVIDDNRYSILFFKDDRLFKKITLSMNHTLLSVEYFSKDDNSIPICTFEPRMSSQGLVIVYKRQGTANQIVMYPLSKEEDTDIRKMMSERFDDYIVKASTDEGIVLFLSDEQKRNYNIVLDQVKEEALMNRQDTSYIDDVDKSLGLLISPKSFNIKKNLASNINICDADDFISGDELLDFVRVNNNPDKIIQMDNSYNYYGTLDNNGLRSGFGRTCLSDGMVAYQGSYLNDLRNGNGAYFYKDGSLCYYGQWEDNKRNGFGIGINSTNRNIHLGDWDDNKPIGNGVRLNAEGDFMFVNKMNEDGTYYHLEFLENGIEIVKYDSSGNVIKNEIIE